MADTIHAGSSDLLKVVILLGAAVIMVPLFKRFGLGSVLGYLVAGLIIGPFGLQFFSDPDGILHVAELGVVMFLFVIGLEMRPSHLWNMRKDIFGLGSLQILFCIGLLTLGAHIIGFPWMSSFLAASGFVLTSTAIVMQILSERGDITLPHGQKIVAILLFEDLLIVPLLALVAFLSSKSAGPEASQWMALGKGSLSLAVLIAAGVWLLNPLFRILALAKAREVMTAAALLVVLGAALLMQTSGLSMAMGAFLAGVLLAESSFRHQIEADIEPFRGILLGLFFIGVGMSLDLSVVINQWLLILMSVSVLMAIKSIGIYLVARFTKSNHQEAVHRAILMAQGGEFAFVLFTTAASANLIDSATKASLSAIVILSMAVTPLFVAIYRKWHAKTAKMSLHDVEEAHDLSGKVLIIGFGRFGQVTSQLLLARNIDVTIIDSDADMIRSASTFGFKVYYGDGSRLDVLRASGATTANAIAICVDQKEVATKIAALVKSEFPQAKVLVRAYDRVHAVELIRAGVDYQMRETFESAFRFGAATLLELGIDQDEIIQITNEIRRRDSERMQLEVCGKREASRSLLFGNIKKQVQTPLLEPKRESKALSSGTAETVAKLPAESEGP